MAGSVFQGTLDLNGGWLRMSLRRRILYLLIVVGFLFLVVNIQQKAIWAQTLLSDGGRAPRANIAEKTVNLKKRSDELPSFHENYESEYNTSKYLQSEENEKTNQSFSNESERPWYFYGGTRRPEPAKIDEEVYTRIADLWPHEKDWRNDRILNQLMFIPPEGDNPQDLKKILFYFGLEDWNLQPGKEAFSNCPVSSCTISGRQLEVASADAILFKDKFVHPGHMRHSKQVWILYFLESPYHAQHIKYNDVINWTATYRRDSDIVTPYEKWVYYNPKVRQMPHPQKNYAANKTKSVAWFVSNCDARNNRLQYANELKKHIPVDIYGACGTKRCPRFPADYRELCFQMLDEEYKFYLAFENSNCRDYITEKLYVNGLMRDILPIVMGAHPEDYAESAPEHSYIHVDDFESPKELAEYLHKLDKDDDLYNSYFRWKGTGEFINTFFLCRLCAMLHDDFPAKGYRDINEWWRGSGVCTQKSWRDRK